MRILYPASERHYIFLNVMISLPLMIIKTNFTAIFHALHYSLNQYSLQTSKRFINLKSSLHCKLRLSSWQLCLPTWGYSKASSSMVPDRIHTIFRSASTQSNITHDRNSIFIQHDLCRFPRAFKTYLIILSPFPNPNLFDLNSFQHLCLHDLDWNGIKTILAITSDNILLHIV